MLRALDLPLKMSNRRSDVALVMHPRPGVYPSVGAGPKEGREHPAYHCVRIRVHLPF